MSKNRETAQSQDPHSLDYEKSAMVKAIKECCRFGIKGDGKNRKKNKTDSIAYRQRGNQYFKSRFHNSEVHAEILKLYTQSIALAPNDSEELSVAYGNRSALLFHLKKYEECIKDCDLALNCCKSDESKAKFSCRKVECLSILKDSKAEEACKEVSDLIGQLNLSASSKDKFMEILNNPRVESNEEKTNKNQDAVELPTFIHQQEAPCASEAVAIKYNQEWGRHIVATRNLDPGEIVAVEKSYCTFVYPADMWFYCQNCVKFTWSSIPCEHCIYGIYCSDECRKEAWEKFHKFECKVFPYIWDMDEDLKGNTSTIRLLLLAVNEVGGISELKKQVLDVDNNKDPRTKGFTKDGVFHSDKFRSIYSLNHIRDLQDPEDRDCSPLYAVPPLYYLATHTTLFGKKIPEDPNQLLLLDDAIFFGALIIRFYNQLSNNFLGFSVSRRDFEIASLGFVTTPFCCLFNHSCDPNIIIVKSDNNEIIAYVERPIHEGEQLFIAYLNNYYQFAPKQLRQMQMSQIYYFDCKCMACLDDWTSESMPSTVDMLLRNPSSALKIGNMVTKFKTVFNPQYMNKFTKYEPELMKELADMLKVYAEALTPHCADYKTFANPMFRLFHRSFGSWFVIPDNC